MLDNPKKTEPLMAALKAAVPFDVELMPALIELLQTENIATLNETRQTVSDVSYAGDEGGIVCHIVPPDRREALVVSLTHLRVSRTMPLASAVIDYQKHRVKKLKSKATAKFANPFVAKHAKTMLGIESGYMPIYIDNSGICTSRWRHGASASSMRAGRDFIEKSAIATNEYWLRVYRSCPTSPSDRAVVHPVSSPIGCVMIRSLPARAGRLPVSSGVARDSH